MCRSGDVLARLRTYTRDTMDERLKEPYLAESQLIELRNMRVLLEEASYLARGLAYHRRARLEAALGNALDEVDRHIEDLRGRGGG